MNKITLFCATTALVMPAMVSAQSTGAVEFEEEIVVTGTRGASDVGGVQTPDSPRARQVLTEEIIRRQTPGQTVNEIINLVPGVSFQNNDPYGSSGGELSIRGFDDTRISQTFDGVPLNDTGNYAIYSNQQLDPELIEQVNVNLGTTEVDSPTASAVGGTVNYRTRLPREEMGAQVVASHGEYEFNRIFGVFDTGTLTSFGTRAFVSGSYATNENPYNRFGRIRKQQYNARLYQPIGDNGDFVSLSGNYNQNRNNFGGSVALRNDRPVPGGFPQDKEDRFYRVTPCQTDTPQANVADRPNGCGTSFDYRFNPSNTGNIRGQSRFSLAENLILTIDPSFQYVKANGGGTVNGFEAACRLGSNGRCGATGPSFIGYIGGRPYAGVDLNGDGDLRDEVTLLAPSQTRTNRYVVISSLNYDINDAHRVRVAYTFDRGRHRQTGEVGFLGGNHVPLDVFPINDPIIDANGNALQKRDRLSFATLHQVSGEYRGEFLDNRLVLQLGLRAPFFTRDLNQFCFTTSASGFVDCFGQDPESNAAYGAARPGAAEPQSVVYKYDKLLPNVGFTYNFADNASVFANYAKGLSVPGTDPLYDSFFLLDDADLQTPAPETTDSFDVGVRYTSGRLQAQISGWYTKYKNRLASAYDPELDETVFRNLGEVQKYGVDGSIAYQPTRNLLFYVFGSYLKSEIQDNVVGGNCSAFQVTGRLFGCTTVGAEYLLLTEGKREGGAPVYTLGARVQGTLGPVELGAQVKRTGKRYVNDENLPILAGSTQIFGATAPAYTIVDLDARVSLAGLGLERTYFQLNVTNLFDELYVGGFGAGADRYRVPFAQIGAPRAVSGSLVIAF